MMRGRTTVAMSVRLPSGEIRTMSEPLPGRAGGRSGLIKIPFVRGVLRPVRDARHRDPDADALGRHRRRGRGHRDRARERWRVTMVVQPRLRHRRCSSSCRCFLSKFAEEAAGSDLVANAVEGLIRLVIFIVYIVAIGMMSRRPAGVRLPRRRAQGDQRLRGRSRRSTPDVGGRVQHRAHPMRDDVRPDRGRHQHLVLLPHPAGRRPAAAAHAVADRARAGDRGGRVRAGPVRRPPLRQPRRPRDLHARACGSSR